LSRFLFGIVLLFFSIGCADYTKEELFQSGVKNLEDGDPKAAIIFLSSALQKDPGFLEARFQLGRAYRIVSKLESAEEELQKVISNDPSFEDAHEELAQIYLLRKRPDEALLELSKLSEDKKEQTRALEMAGTAYALKGEYAEAINLLTRATENDHAGQRPFDTLAEIYLQSGNEEKARIFIAKALEESPEGRRPLLLLAKIESRGQNVEEAIQAYDRILRRHPDDGLALLRKGVLLVRHGRYEEALAVSQSFIDRYPKRPEGYRIQGISFLHRKQFDEAIASLEKAVSIHPESLAFYYLALAHYGVGQLEQSVSSFYRSLDSDPSFLQARAFVAATLLKQRRVEEAIPENLIAYNVLGSGYIELGQYDRGLEAFDRALQINPKLAKIQMQKGLALRHEGEHDEAEAAMQAAIDIAPEVVSSRTILASLYLQDRKYGEALKVLQEGLSGQKSDALLHNRMADVLLKMNRITEAEEHLKMAVTADPHYSIARNNLALVYVLQGEEQKAVQELQAILNLTPDYLPALLALGGLYELRGASGDALEHFRRARSTGKVEGYRALALYLMRTGVQEEAANVLEEGMRSNSTSPELYDMQAKLFASMGRYEASVKALEGLRKIDPERGLAALVTLDMSFGKTGSALRRVQKELSREPDNERMLREAARIYSLMGDAPICAPEISVKHFRPLRRHRHQFNSMNRSMLSAEICIQQEESMTPPWPPTEELKMCDPVSFTRPSSVLCFCIHSGERTRPFRLIGRCLAFP
jgi:putative PEP-CTERM system TPR-repeat lipoprotein